MKKNGKSFLKMFLLFAAIVGIVFTGCKSDINPNSLEYGTLSVKSSEISDNSRAIYNKEITYAQASIIGYNSKGETFTKTSELTAVSAGKASGITIESIPVCKNAVVVVQAYSGTGNTQIDGIRISAITDIKADTTNSVNVNWESTNTGNVFEALLAADVNTNALTQEQVSSIENAIPTDTHACLINATQIASDYKNDSLGEASSYKLTAGSVNVTCYEYDGCTLQINDPLSLTATADVADSPVTISDVAPGTWTLYVLDGTTVKTSKTVTVTSGNEVEVEVGEQQHDGYRVHLVNADSWSIHKVYAYSDSNADVWPGNVMTQEADGYYIDLTQTWIVAGTTRVIFYGGSDSNRYPADGQPGLVIPADVTEAWYDLSTHEWSLTNPNTPTAPTYTLPSSATVGGTFTITVTSSTALTASTVTIGGVAKTLIVGSNLFNVSDFTSEATTLTVTGTLTNSVGSTTVSGSITVKEAGKLVTNPNELRIYQVMVSSFQDGDSSIGYKAAYGPSNATKGGDLRGIINALDYIQGLGCNALWMTPIFQSNGGDYDQMSSTGYFAYDYFNIDNHFGTNEVFDELVEECHNRGIAVILDGVFGHNGGSVAQSPSRNGILNPGITPDTDNPVNYATNENSLKYYSDVARYWITEHKIDGWRFDQCYQLANGEYNSGSNCNTGGHNYWYEIRNVIEAAAASNGTKGTDWGTLGYMVGEDWDGNASRIQACVVDSWSSAGYGLNSCFDFPAYYQIVQAFAQEWGGTTTGNITTGLSYLYKTYTEKGYSCKDSDGTYDIYYPNFMLTNHDLYRIGDLINKKWSCGYENDEYVGRNKVLLAAQCAYSGPITIYYGDEIGARSADNSNGTGWYSDNVARSSGKISGFTTYEQAVHDWTQKCLEARADHEALWNGTNTQITGDSDFYVAKKQGGGETIYIAFNYNSSSSKTFSASGTDLISGQTYNGTVTVPALSAVYILAQ